MHATQRTIKKYCKTLLLCIVSAVFMPCHLTKILLFYVDWQKYQWDSHHATACQVSSLIKLIKQTEKRCLAEWILGSGNANRCAFLSFSILWQLTTPVWAISRMLFGLFLKSITHLMLICITSLQNLINNNFSSVFTLVKPAFSTVGRWFTSCRWWPLWYIVCTATFG